MSLIVWTLQFLLAIAFVASGMMKIVVPYEQLEQRMTWVAAAKPAQVKAIGVLEVVGGIGLIIPVWVPFLPTLLTPLASIGLGIIMIGAIYVHIRLKEIKEALPAAIMLALLVLLTLGLFAVDRY